MMINKSNRSGKGKEVDGGNLTAIISIVLLCAMFLEIES
jgi:hypothetical protein